MKKKLVKKLTAICAMLSVIMMSTSMATAMTTVEPDDFDANTDISTTFWGVTLSSVGDGWGSPSGAVLAIDPPSGGTGFNPSTVSLAFGTDGDNPHLFWGKDELHFRADFTQPGVPAIFVSVDFIGNDVSGDGDTGELYAYDAGDVLVASAFSNSLDKNEWQTVSVSGTWDGVSGTTISYILAFGHQSSSVSWDTIGIDNLQWEPIPAPGAILLGSLGVGLVGWLRRRQAL